MDRNNNSKPDQRARSAAGRPKRSQQQLLPATTYIPSSVRCPPVLDPFGRDDKGSVVAMHGRQLRRKFDGALLNLGPGIFDDHSSPGAFQWLDRQRNNSSGDSSSRKLASKEMSRRDVENWCHMYFRFRMEAYPSLIYAVKQSSKDESLYSEEHLEKWTTKMRFRIRKSSPLKMALMACTARLGLENDADVIFCTDGFYGDALTGCVGNKNDIANRVVQATSTCRAMGLANGSSLFVSRATRADRENAAAQVQLDFMRTAEVSSAGSSTISGSRRSHFEEEITAMSQLLLETTEIAAGGRTSFRVGKDVSSKDLMANTT